MKKLLIIGLLISFVYAGSAQSEFYNNGIAIKTIFLDYQSQNGGNITAFREYSQGLEVGYLHE